METIEYTLHRLTYVIFRLEVNRLHCFITVYVIMYVLVLLFVLCGLFYEAICFMSYLVSFCSCVFFSVLLALRLPCLGKRELILVPVVRFFDLCLFGFVGFLFLLVSGKSCGCECGTPWTFLLPFITVMLNRWVIRPLCEPYNVSLYMPLEGCASRL